MFQYCVVSVGKKDLIVRNLNSLVKGVVSFVCVCVCVWGGSQMVEYFIFLRTCKIWTALFRMPVFTAPGHYWELAA